MVLQQKQKKLQDFVKKELSFSIAGSLYFRFGEEEELFFGLLREVLTARGDKEIRGDIVLVVVGGVVVPLFNILILNCFVCRSSSSSSSFINFIQPFFRVFNFKYEFRDEFSPKPNSLNSL